MNLCLTEEVLADDIQDGDQVWRDDEWQKINRIVWTDRKGGYFSFTAHTESGQGRKISSSWVSGIPVLRKVQI